MKLIWCSRCHGSVVNLRREWGQSVMKLIQCSSLPWIYGQLEGVVQRGDLPSLV